MRTTLLSGPHSSSRLLVPPVGRRARTTQTTPSEYVRTTLLFGAHSSSRLLVASVLRQLVTDHSAAELPKPHLSDLFAPRSASMLHSTSPRVASTSPKIGRRLVLFERFGALRHMHDAPRTSILESTLRMTIDGDFACGERASFSRSPCRGSFLEVFWAETGGARGMFGLFRLVDFSRTRVIVWVSVHTSIRLAGRTHCCSLSAEHSTATNFTLFGPLPDLSRSTAFHHCASRSFNLHHFAALPTTAKQKWARCQCMPYTAGFPAVEVTVQQPSRLLCSCPSTT